MELLTLRDYLQETEDAISSGQLDDALARCQAVLARFPQALEAHRLLGEVYLAQGQLDDAQQAFNWVLMNDPENVIAYCDRALISERQSDYDTALDCYQQAYELSRGNSQIRNEFHKLSSRLGQQGFMFSRAGLARLYVRGGLLSQAVQEWEAVLAVTPDRLDARTGLLETYWREGLYDRVDQLATQILVEVPGCLKAILMMAYVTSLTNIPRAQEYMEQANDLDPDQVMAQELFAELLNKQIPDPFVQFFRKEPLRFQPDGSVEAKPASTPGSDTFSDFSFSSPPSPALDSPLFPGLAGDENSSLAPWSQDLAQSLRQQTPEQETTLPTWAREMLPPEPEQQPASQPSYSQPGLAGSISNPSVSDLAGLDIWGDEEETFSSWSERSTSENQQAAPPPAWLSMLTQGEINQMSVEQPAVEVVEPAPEPAVAPFSFLNDLPPAPVAQPEPVLPPQPEPVLSVPQELPVQPERLTPLPAVEIEEEEMMFGPAWLKSLGATSIEEEAQPLVASEPVAPLAVQPPLAELPPQEQQVIATLEDLEKNLFAQGFVSLQPNTLAKISQSQTLPQAEEPNFLAPQPVMQNTMPEEDAQLSSALAGLGYLGNPQPEEKMPEWSQPPVQQVVSPPPPVPAPEPVLETFAKPQEMSDVFASLELLAAKQPEPQKPLEAPGVRVKFEPPIEETIPAARGVMMGEQNANNPFLDSELEMTMRRPAVRLQHMQSRTNTRKPVQPARPQPEQTSVSHAGLNGQNGNLSGQDHLLKGYQLQLAGKYDEAMQEYRHVIKNTPELLADVVSHLRALLKISPRYSAGYRVLGDAYMRQGEYLQAMEAFNKGLAVAKRTRG